MYMLWLFQILFNKDLKAREAKRRQAFVEENNAFIENLEKLKLMQSSLPSKSADNVGLVLLSCLNIDELIVRLKNINVSCNMVLVSPKDVDMLKKYVTKAKKHIEMIIKMSKITDKIDSFFDLDISDTSIFKKTANFTSAIDSFQKL